MSQSVSAETVLHALCTHIVHVYVLSVCCGVNMLFTSAISKYMKKCLVINYQYMLKKQQQQKM